MTLDAATNLIGRLKYKPGYILTSRSTGTNLLEITLAIPRDDKMEPDRYRAILEREFVLKLEQKDLLNVLKGIVLDFEKEEVLAWLTLDGKPVYEEPSF